jgi:hypothetical protein
MAVALTGPDITSDPGPANLGVPVVQAQLGGNAIEIIESHSSRWLFDCVRHRLLRLPRGIELDVSVLALPWQAYVDVRLDDDGNGVVVTLAGGGRLRLDARESHPASS